MDSLQLSLNSFGMKFNSDWQHHQPRVIDSIPFIFVFDWIRLGFYSFGVRFNAVSSYDAWVVVGMRFEFGLESLGFGWNLFGVIRFLCLV